jgi:hypothetical protein
MGGDDGLLDTEGIETGGQSGGVDLHPTEASKPWVLESASGGTSYTEHRRRTCMSSSRAARSKHERRRHPQGEPRLNGGRTSADLLASGSWTEVEKAVWRSLEAAR